MPSRKLPGSGNAKDPSGSAPSSGSRATTAAAQQQRLRNFLLAGVAVLVLAFIVAWLGGASGRGGTAHFAEDLPDLVFDEGKLPGYKKKNVSLADSDLVAEWLRQQDGFRDAARFLKRAGFDSSARYVQTCFESTGVATRPHENGLGVWGMAGFYRKLGSRAESSELSSDRSGGRTCPSWRRQTCFANSTQTVFSLDIGPAKAQIVCRKPRHIRALPIAPDRMSCFSSTPAPGDPKSESVCSPGGDLRGARICHPRAPAVVQEFPRGGEGSQS